MQMGVNESRERKMGKIAPLKKYQQHVQEKGMKNVFIRLSARDNSSYMMNATIFSRRTFTHGAPALEYTCK